MLTVTAYYNEFDPYAAQWLRNLIAAGHIAPGEVDERSIVDVRADDLRGFVQCHFFAGIGVWSHALRLARWPDDRPVWTGSCPCQPFSTAGKSDEFADERHLWPAWFRLIRECLPVAVFGEQVASKIALAWIDHVCADLEGAGYTVGAVDSCAAGFGAPHRRQRLYWVADANSWRCNGIGLEEYGIEQGASWGELDRCGTGQRWSRQRRSSKDKEPRTVDHSNVNGLRSGGRAEQSFVDESTDGQVRGWWQRAEWFDCGGGKSRPGESGAVTMVTRTPAVVGRLRAYGNAIVAPQAAEFVKAYVECATWA